MDAIELGKAIATYGIPIITGVMLVLVIGLVWYLIRRQTKREDKQDKERIERQNKFDKTQEEARQYHRKIITNHLEHINDTSLKNTELNIQGIALQKEMIKELKNHNKSCVETSKKTFKSFEAIYDKINGKNSKKVGEKK